MPSERPATRDRLLSAAATLFAERGFHSVSIREICKRAETSINMVHHYFGSKDGLLEAIFEQFGEHVFAVPMRLLDTPAKSRDDFESRIEMLFEATLDAYLANRDVALVVIGQQPDVPPLLAYTERLVDFLEQGKESGFVRKELDAEMISGAILGRLLQQVQFAPWIKRTYGTDISDPDYKKRWCAANLDLYLRGMLSVTEP